MKDNKQVYSTVEFNSWVAREGMIKSERHLFQKFLSPDQETLEAGTSGGRLLYELQKQGFKKLWGFDYVPEFINEARKRDVSGKITFDVMDASALSYADNSFGQIVYLQQIISLIESKKGRTNAISEACRILRPGGTALFSFLCLESRKTKISYRCVMIWLRILRLFRGCHDSIQYLPWFKLDGKTNWSGFWDAKPYVYWYRAEEVEDALIDAGLIVIAAGTDAQVESCQMQSSASRLQGLNYYGHIYFVCKKP